MKQFSKNSGFTLIELVVSIGILAILAVFVLAQLNPVEQFKKARDGERKSDISQIQKALEQYYQDHGSYPTSTNVYKIQDFSGNPVDWGGASGWTPYLNVVPADPDNTRSYVYYAFNSGQSYRLYASLERGPSDVSTCQASVTNCRNNPTSVQYCSCTGIPVGATCGSGKVCNYGVSSPNTTP